ncbi:MAG: hypothetical protein EOM59_12905 [Clostridia bacterium]|jgi:hypothetical protein|nr:hypothetical protein [Clostridia bacterium]
MNNFIEELKKYFEVTPKSKVLEDWAKCAEFDHIGPTASEYILSSPACYVYSTELHKEPQKNIINDFSPKFSSGFFLTK